MATMTCTVDAPPPGAASALPPPPVDTSKVLAIEHPDPSRMRSNAQLSWWEVIKVWSERIHWINTFILLFVPAVSIVGLYTTPLQRPTVIWAVVYYLITGLGITAGYHRMFAHRAFQANWITRFAMMLAGSGALEGSIKWWCGGHRIHHRYTDTPKDPYNASGGFWYAHIGWMMIKPDPANFVKSDIRDLNADPIVRWQHKNYLWIGPFMAFVFPTLVAGFGWGDWMGGYMFAGALRLFFVHHSTFCVNSVAHFFGEHSFDDARTPRDSIVTALLTFGEGYHNFHHEFPNDYRNGIKWYHYDPTKWLISSLWALGAATNLRMFPMNEIKRGVLYMREKKLAEMRASIHWPKTRAQLPTISWVDFVRSVQRDHKAWIVMDGFVHDVAPFIAQHPGGEALIRGFIGRDATATFRGRTNPVIYKHSHAAENLLSNMRVAVIDPATMPLTTDKKLS